jgi:hypothetical protein
MDVDWSCLGNEFISIHNLLKDLDNVLFVTGIHSYWDGDEKVYVHRYQSGPTSVHIAGPTVEIPQTRLGDTYSMGGEGTSMASPHVSAGAAMLFAYDPTLTPGDVKERLMKSAAYRPELENKCKSRGVLNIQFALRAGAEDLDGDGYLNADDTCPEQADPDQEDNDDDGFGRACDCNDTNPDANPDASENCDNGTDDDCDGLTDHNDPDCPLPYPPNAQAAVYGAGSVSGSGIANQLVLLLVPLCAGFLLRIMRRKK